MAVSLKHKFASAKSDGGDATLVRPSNWNDEHDLTLSTARLLGRVTAGTGAAEEVALGAGLQFSAAGGLESYAPFGDSRAAVFFDDFLGGVGNVQSYVSGGELAIEPYSTFGPGGSLRMRTGTGTTGRGAFIWPSGNPAANQIIYFGAGAAVFEVCVLRFDALSDGTNTYSSRIGFTRDPAVGNPQDGLFFEYDPSTRSNHNWWCVSRNNNSNRAVDSGVEASISAPRTLRIEVNAAGTEVRSYINGSLVDTNTTNVPSGSSRMMGYGGAIQKIAGSTQRAAYIDYLLIVLHFPSGRP